MPTIERWRGAEFWLQSVALARNLGFDANELAELLAHVSSRQVAFLEAWHGHFGAWRR